MRHENGSAPLKLWFLAHTAVHPLLCPQFNGMCEMHSVIT